MKQFKPMLATDATDHLEELKFPKYASTKLDGIRVLFIPELGMVSRSLKQIPNKQLQMKFGFMTALAKADDMVYDGEIYCHGRTFQEITRACMTKDFTDSKTNTKLSKSLAIPELMVPRYWYELIDDMEFHCFECVHIPDANGTFQHRRFDIRDLNFDKVVSVNQHQVENSNEVKELFTKKLDEGYEGLILRSSESPYKFGRSTLKEEYMLKVKPFETFDAKIIDVVQATEVDPTAKKTINELGRSVTSKKKDDRMLIPMASAFTVGYQNNTVKVTLAMTDKEKEEVWLYRDSYIGRMIEYKGMLIGAKNVPRHPVFVRFREDRQ